ncbi:MAG: glycosyltransferase [Acidimicrobiales bacterium]|nr:glycosyltransferase [Acidimicrobiales bacterium]
MKVLQVVTWVAPGNPFGGPVRVALNHVQELRRRGHDVRLVAAQPRRAARGRWSSSELGVQGFDAFRVLPGAGFSGVTSPKILRLAWRAGRRVDLVHVHLARDLVTLPFAAIVRWRKVPYVVQCHGMVDASSRRSARALDALLTRRVLRSAAAVFVLTDHEREEMEKAFPGESFAYQQLPNGVPVPELERPASCTAGGAPEILFCSRLHPRKRPALFARAAVALLDRGVEAEFAIVGSDEGELPAVRIALATGEHGGEVTVEESIEPDAVAERLARCDALVLPSVEEPFPMVVLEALAASRPVVVTDTCGLASFVTDNRCGIVVPGDDLDALIAAVDRLVTDPCERVAMGARGRSAVDEHLGMRRIGEQLEQTYRTARQ